MDLTVDIIVTYQDKILLIERAKEPFMDKLVLPGGHMEETDLSLAHAAIRELREEVGIKAHASALSLLTTLDGLDRDPRGRKISVVFLLDIQDKEDFYCAHAASDARKIVILKKTDLSPNMIGFDHWQAIDHVF